MESAYDSIVEYSGEQSFAAYRRALISDRGLIASGRLPKGMVLTYVRVPVRPTASAQMSFVSETVQEPVELLESTPGVRKSPGLIFTKEGYRDIISQAVSKQKIKLDTLLDALLFTRSADENNWNTLAATQKRKLLGKNVAALNKETAMHYRLFGERMHYLTIGRVVTVDNELNEQCYPLVLFSCEKIDERELVATVDMSGFMNFWLDKNILQDMIARRYRGNFEVNLGMEIGAELNDLAGKINSMSFTEYQSLKVDPTYIGIQIINGFDAEYIDPAWDKIIG